MTFKEIKQKSKKQLAPYSKLATLALLFNYAIAMVFAIPYIMTYSFHVSWLQGPALVIAILYFCYAGFLAPVLSIAFFTFIAQIAKQSNSTEENNLTLKNFFKNFRLAGKGIGNYWWTYLWEFLWGLLGIIPVLIIVFIIVITQKDSVPTSSTSLIGSIIPIITVLFIFPIMIYKALSYCMNNYIIADNNTIGVIKAMNISKAITKGFRGELFGFYMSFFGWYLLEIITLGIASLWIEPYIKISVYNFYKELSANYKPEDQKAIDASTSENPNEL